VAVHRKHHAFPTPRRIPTASGAGFWPSRWEREALPGHDRDGVTVTRYSRDLPPDRLDRLIFDHAFAGLAIGIAFLSSCSPRAGLVAAGIHTVIYLATNSAVNAVGHTFGKRPYDISPPTTSGWPGSPAVRAP